LISYTPPRARPPGEIERELSRSKRLLITMHKAHVGDQLDFEGATINSDDMAHKRRWQVADAGLVGAGRRRGLAKALLWAPLEARTTPAPAATRVPNPRAVPGSGHRQRRPMQKVLATRHDGVCPEAGGYKNPAEDDPENYPKDHPIGSHRDAVSCPPSAHRNWALRRRAVSVTAGP
jgi:hypothetical protein